MKKLFLSLIALMVTIVSYSQNTLVATLTHDDAISMYYGSYAFRDAMNAAVSGDVINLSGGSFQATTINKAVTLRGTGIDENNPTRIINDFSVQLSKEDTNDLSIEGIIFSGIIRFYGSLTNEHFTKCQFYVTFFMGNSSHKKVLFADCRITNWLYLGSTIDVQCINTLVYGYDNRAENKANASFMNCVIYPYGNDPQKICSSQLYNSIVCGVGNSSKSFPASSIATNCVAINYPNLFNNSQINSASTYSTFEEVFKDFSGAYSDTQTFELTDEAKTKYLGTDGTQVGMYGGILPYNSTPSYPRITKMNVANKTTADGKLSVEIEVSAAK